MMNFIIQNCGCLCAFRRRQWHPTPVLLPGKSHGWKSLVGCSPWGHEESDTTEKLHFTFHFSCFGERNDNPLQCSCLENPRDGGAWWAAVSGVAQSWTQVKQLSSSSRVTFTYIQWRKGLHRDINTRNQESLRTTLEMGYHFGEALWKVFTGQDYLYSI